MVLGCSTMLIPAVLFTRVTGVIVILMYLPAALQSTVHLATPSNTFQTQCRAREGESESMRSTHQKGIKRQSQHVAATLKCGCQIIRKVLLLKVSKVTSSVLTYPKLAFLISCGHSCKTNLDHVANVERALRQMVQGSESRSLPASVMNSQKTESRI